MLLRARINKGIGMNHKANNDCNIIFLTVKLLKEYSKPKKYWLIAAKAAQIQAI